MSDELEGAAGLLGAGHRDARPELEVELATLEPDALLGALRTIASVPAVEDVQIGPELAGPAGPAVDG